MRALDKATCAAWCAGRGLRVRQDQAVTYPAAVTSVSFIFEKYPAPRLLAFLNGLVSGDNERSTKRWLLWLTEWGIWNDTDEAIGAELVGALRLSGGVTTPFWEQPGLLLEATEDKLLVASMLSIAAIGWDAYIIPDDALSVIFLHHHGVGSVFSDSRERIESVRNDFEGFDAIVYAAH